MMILVDKSMKISRTFKIDHFPNALYLKLSSINCCKKFVNRYAKDTVADIKAQTVISTLWECSIVSPFHCHEKCLVRNRTASSYNRIANRMIEIPHRIRVTLVQIIRIKFLSLARYSNATFKALDTTT